MRFYTYLNGVFAREDGFLKAGVSGRYELSLSSCSFPAIIPCRQTSADRSPSPLRLSVFVFRLSSFTIHR
jgi:hypothetical protein